MVGENELWLHVWAILLLAAVGGAAAFGVWRLFPTVRRRLLPLAADPPRRWTGLEVFAVFVLFLLGVPAILALFEQARVFEAIYGGPVSTERKQLWVWLLATPLIVGAAFMLLYKLSGTRPSAYGMTPVRAAPNIVAAYLVWLMLAPIVIAIFFAVIQGMSAEQLLEEQHPLEKMARERVGLLPIEWALIVFQAVFAAPLLEELVFRGVLLGWLRRASLTGHVVVAGVGMLCGFLAMIGPRFPDEGPPGDLKYGPFLFALVLAPVYLIPVFLREHARRAGRLPEACGTDFWTPPHAPTASETGIEAVETGVRAPTSPAGIESANGADTPRTEFAAGPPPALLPLPLLKIRDFFLRTPWRHRVLDAWGPVGGSAYLFAMFHSSVWPHPIPLLMLALGLGWLAYRTRSLVGPIVVHALFNGIACLVLALGVAQSAENGRAQTTPWRPSVSGSMINAVPGSWLPRFK